MKKNQKIRVAVLYGGKSGEHEVSLRSGASIIRYLDREKFEVIPIGIDHDGRWHLNSVKLLEQAGETLPAIDAKKSERADITLSPSSTPVEIDVVFPAVHGPLCEDGALQGVLETANLAYVGSGVLASAVGMDKDMTKKLCALAGVPVAPYMIVRKPDWTHRKAEVLKNIQAKLSFPIFVKPANMGSSVGIHKVKQQDQLESAVIDAFRYDSKILIEEGIDAREIELSVLENIDEGGAPLVSIAGEITPTHEFYSYDAKYLDENGAHLLIPAKIDAKQMKEAQKIAANVFTALECEGLARVDLFLDRKTNRFYLNEINTLPGFTSISMYPKLWEASGVGYQELLTKLVELAIARHERKKKILRKKED